MISFVLFSQASQPGMISIYRNWSNRLNSHRAWHLRGSQGEKETRVYGSRNGAKFNESKSLPTSTTNLQFNIFFYINNKIRPTLTINIIINIRNMPNSTTRENQHQQKFFFSSTTICLTTNIGHRLQQQKHVQQFGDERLAMVEGGWGPGILIMGLAGK